MAFKIGPLQLMVISVLLIMIESDSHVKDVCPKFILRTQTPEPVFFRVIITAILSCAIEPVFF